MNDLDDQNKLDLEAQYNRMVSAYNNAKGHVESLSLPVMTWADLKIKAEKMENIIWCDKSLDLFTVSDATFSNPESVKELINQGKVKIMSNDDINIYPEDKKFRVIYAFLYFIQEI